MDILIRDVDEATVKALDALAADLYMSRENLLRTVFPRMVQHERELWEWIQADMTNRLAQRKAQ